jgi:hypothetical protein
MSWGTTGSVSTPLVERAGAHPLLIGTMRTWLAAAVLLGASWLAQQIGLGWPWLGYLGRVTTAGAYAAYAARPGPRCASLRSSASSGQPVAERRAGRRGSASRGLPRLASSATMMA